MKIPVSLFLALSAFPVFALDLSPRFITTTSDGVSIRRPYFSDGGKKYSVTLNVETELLPYEDGALFRFIKLKQAEMRLRPSAFSVEIKFGPDTLERYEQGARKLLPPTARDIVLDQQTPNPLTINGWQSHRFIFKYNTDAGEVRESITFLNITPAQQVVVQTAAMAKDFQDACERAYDIIRRWHLLDPVAMNRGS